MAGWLNTRCIESDEYSNNHRHAEQRALSLGKLTFPLVLEYVDDMKTVSEKAIIEAVQFLFYRMKLVVEPSGALGLAALLSQAVVPEGRVGIILSGGNIDSDTMITILSGVIS